MKKLSNEEKTTLKDKVSALTDKEDFTGAIEIVKQYAPEKASDLLSKWIILKYNLIRNRNCRYNAPKIHDLAIEIYNVFSIHSKLT